MSDRTVDFMVVGAGSVGLFAALTLASRGLEVRILDAKPAGGMNGYAVPLHPLTLERLHRFDVVEELTSAGRRVDRIAFYRGRDRVGELDFGALDGAFPHILIVPLSTLEGALERRLASEGITVDWGHRIDRVEEEADGVGVLASDHRGRRKRVRAATLIGADGCNSFTRTGAGIAYREMQPAETFLVAEGSAPPEIGDAIAVVLQGTKAVSSVWPLARGRTRWNLGVSSAGGSANREVSVGEIVREQAPWVTAPASDELDWITTAVFERRLVDTFVRGPVWIAGDAAHSAGPSAAHSMNLGFEEVWELIGRRVERGRVREIVNEELAAAWQWMFGRSGRLQATETTPEWAHSLDLSVLDAIPASGAHLEALLDQIGLRRS